MKIIVAAAAKITVAEMFLQIQQDKLLSISKWNVNFCLEQLTRGNYANPFRASHLTERNVIHIFFSAPKHIYPYTTPRTFLKYFI